ncbi:hypothetical protein MTR_3g070020 [Medicago truncatula]|uniref:Uncharacterized protein n=1 Tax=Medicago truncatula TaxID=3880 RepID=G7JAN1_MEDTR|nr:hypothetical protein MTR_3g070020 [Medicago truncatula]
MSTQLQHMNVDVYLKVILECDDNENSKVIFYGKAYEFCSAYCDCKVFITKECIWKVKEVSTSLNSTQLFRHLVGSMLAVLEDLLVRELPSLFLGTLICAVLSLHSNFKVKFIRRQTDMVAHTLVRAAGSWASHRIFDSYPSYIEHWLINDNS